MSPLVKTAPIGTVPLVKPFATVRISGVTSNRVDANASPVLPKPQITSSKINMIPCFVHISLIFLRYPLGGRKTPAEPAIGSIITPAIVDGS